MQFSGKEAVKIAAALAFPRAVGTAGEEAAASLIEKQLSSAGYHPFREEFVIPLAPWTAMRVFLSLAIAVLAGAKLLAAFFPVASGALILVLIAVLASYDALWLKIAGSEFFRSRLAREKNPLRSWNIVAELPPAAKTGCSLYFVAHYDSKSQSVPLLLRAFLLLLSGLASLWLAFTFLALAAGFPALFASPYADVSFILALSGLAALLLLSTGNRSPGALDNAGSVGLLLHLAAVLKERRPKRLEIKFIFTGGEELGLQGAFAYLRKHAAEMEKGKIRVFNLDSVGIQGRTKIFSGKSSLRRGSRSPFLNRLREIGSPLGVRFQPFYFGIMMDHQAFLEKGFQAVSLACASKKILKIHTPGDSVDLLEEAGMEEAGRFLLAWLREADQSCAG